MKYLKKLYYKNISPNFFKPSNKQTKFKIFKTLELHVKISEKNPWGLVRKNVPVDL